MSTADPVYNYALAWYRQKAAEVRTAEQARAFREGIERAVETCAMPVVAEELRKIREGILSRG